MADAMLGRYTPLQAQNGDAAAPKATAASGAGIRLDDPVERITYTIIDRFEVQLANLRASTTAGSRRRRAP